MPPELYSSLASAGLPATLMAVAVWWLQRTNAQLVSELNRERSERLDVMEQNIRDCDTDRKELRNMLLNHLRGTERV